MALTNCYCTLAELKSRLNMGKTYTATTISFANGTTKTISDTALGLEMFPTGNRITVSGSTSNDGTYTIATGGVAASIVTSEALPLTEVAGDTVTITDITDVIDDATLESVITAISRAIDNITDRRFYRNTVDETRYYTLDSGECNDSTIFFCPDDIGSITTLKMDQDGDRTYEETWTTSDYDLMPYNASADGWPYTWIETTPQGDYSFSRMRKGIEIIGKFGFASSTPATIKEACLLLALKLFKRKDAVFGMAGAADLGTIVAMARRAILADSEIQLMLGPYKRWV